jgi:hypothetical protein
MNRLMAFKEARVLAMAKGLTQVIDSRDARRWSTVWSRLGFLANPVDYLLGSQGDAFLADDRPDLSHLGPSRMPEPDSEESRGLLRFVVWKQMIHQIELMESAWSVQFPELVRRLPALSLDGSAEYRALREVVFTRGVSPSGLECLDQDSTFITNWIPLASVRRLAKLEAQEHLLLRLADELSTEPLGSDLDSLRRLLGVAPDAGWSLYLWSPGPS